MAGKFVLTSGTTPQVLEWGRLGWLSNPPNTGASNLTVIEVKLDPGKGHAFHHHPDQEEVIFVVSGRVEQWLDRENKILGPGDSAFIPAGVVHASFNAGEGEAHILAILGPCVGDQGYVSVEVAAEEPWKSLRA